MAGTKRRRDDVSEADTSDAGLRSRILQLLGDEASKMLPSDVICRKLRMTDEEGKQRVLDQFNHLVEAGRTELYQSYDVDGRSLACLKLVEESRVGKMSGLSEEDKAVLGAVEKAGSNAVWVRSIKASTKLQQAALNKILKRLEGKKLIKQVKSVLFKQRRMFMLYELEPAKELTGGVWYTDQALDLPFIEEMKSQVLKCLQATDGRATVAQVCDRVLASHVCNVPLKPADIQQVMDLLVYEGLLDVEDGAKARVDAAIRAGHAIFPRKTALLAKSGGKRAAGAREDDDMDEGLDDEEDEDDAAGKVYVLVNAIDWAARVPVTGYLSSVPCGTCPVHHLCTPGGLISPETCVYMSHWLQF